MLWAASHSSAVRENPPDQEPAQEDSKIVSLVQEISLGDQRSATGEAPLRPVWSLGAACKPGVPINVTTQGILPDFQPIGTLVGDGKTLPLMGRPAQIRRSIWNYFTKADNYGQVQMPITYKRKNCMDSQGCDELSSGDIVLTTSGEKMTVQLYPPSCPSYIPDVI